MGKQVFNNHGTLPGALDGIKGIRESASGGKVISGTVLHPVGKDAYKKLLIEKLAACQSEEERADILIEERNRIYEEQKAFNQVYTEETEKNGFPPTVSQWGECERPLTEKEKQWHKDWNAAGRPTEFRGVITIGDS